MVVAPIVIRPPEPKDGPDMGLTHVLAWQVGYRGIVPEPYLESLDAEQQGSAWTDHLTRENAAAMAGTPMAGTLTDGSPQSASLVAEVDRRVVGISSYGAYRRAETATEAEPDDLSELWMLNVHPDHWGSGVAQALMARIKERLVEERSEPRAALWVLERNARGRRFYEKEGWTADGGRKTEQVGGSPLVEFRYVILL